MLLFYVTNVKDFMNVLLKSDLFDGYEARGVTLQTFTRFEIDCVRADAEEKNKFCLWGDVKEYVFNLIKGKTPPKRLKIRLCLSSAAAESIHQNAAALHMTVTYEDGGASILTGASQKQFSLDKELDSAWDNYVVSFFSDNCFEIRESQE